MATPTPNPAPVVGSISDMLKKPGTQPSATGKVSAPKPAAVTGSVGSIADMMSGKKTTTPAAAKPAAAPVSDAVKAVNSTISVGNAILNTAMTPMYWMEDLAYRLATPSSKSQQTKWNADIAKKGYLGWMADQWGISAKNATAWQRGEAVKHTGGSIAKNLGLINKDKGFWPAVQNVATGTAFDIALDPLTYTPAAPVVDALKAVVRGTTAGVRGMAAGAKGVVTVENAAKALGKDAAGKLESKIVEPRGNVGIRPKNLPTPGTAPLAEGVQKIFEEKLAKAKPTVVQLPNAIDRTVSQTAKDAVATGLSMGWSALRSTMLSHTANNFLERYAKRSAEQIAADTARLSGTHDYTYNVAEKVAAKAEAPKPSEISVAPKTVKKAKVAFPENAPTPYEAAMTTVGKQDIKQISSTLKAVDNIAKRVIGTQASSKGLSETVSRFIQGIDNSSHTIFKAMKPETQKAIKDAISLNEYNPKLLFEEQITRAKNGNKVAAAFAGSYGNRIIPFSTGRAKIGAFLKDNANVPFSQLSVSDRQHLISALQHFTSDQSTALEEQLGSIVRDKNVAKELIDAGALNGTRANIPAVKAILDKIAQTASGDKVKYGSAEELIAGLRAGDIISADSLMKIVKRLDPANSTIAKLEKSATKPSYEMMAEILKSPSGVPETLAAMRQRFNYANTQVFMKATGLGLSDAVAANLDARILGQLELTPEIHAATRQYAANSVAKMGNEAVRDDTMLIHETFAQRFAAAEETLAKKGSHARISDLGDNAVLGATTPYKGAEAILVDQTSQSWQSILVAKLTGMITARTGTKVAKMTEEQALGFNVAREKMVRFTLRMVQTSDLLLATTGSRMFIQKERKEVGANIAEGAHKVFLHMGDIVHEFMKTDNGFNAIQKSFFTVGEGFAKTDSLETVSVLNTVRRVLESRERNLPLDMQELKKGLLRREGKATLSQKFILVREKAAEDFLIHLTTTDVAANLEKVHLDRALAATEDYLTHSLDISNQIIKLMKDSWAAAYKTGWANKEEQFQHIKDLFNRFTYMADLVRQEDGSVAESVMRAASMVLVKNGKLAPAPGEELANIYKLFPDAGSEDYAKMWEIINSYARHENPHLAPPVGRESLPKPKPEVVAKVQTDLAMAEDAITAHIKAAAKLDNLKALTEWRATAKKLAANLDKQRGKAWYAWLPTRHWSNISKKWIPSESYDHAAEIEWAKANPPILVGDQVVRVAQEMLDSTPQRLKGAGDGATVAATKAARNKAIKNHQAAQATVSAEDAAAKVLEEANKIDALGLDPAEQALRMLDEANFQQFDAMAIKIDEPRTVVYSNLTSKTPKNAPENFAQVPLVQRLTENWSMTGGRRDVAGYLQMTESAIHTYRSDLGRAMHRLYDTYGSEITYDQFGEAMSRALSKQAVDETASIAVQGFQQRMNTIMSGLLYDVEANNISMDLLKSAFKRYGLTDRDGFKLHDDLAETIKNLPFGPRPANMADGTREAIEWADRRDAFANSGTNPFMAFIKIGSAVQHVKSLQNLSAMLVSNVGYKAYGKTYEEAVKDGFVALKSTKPSQLLEAMAGPQEGALFHPGIANQIASLDRQYTKLMAGNEMGKVTRTIMRLTGYLKFSQTAINPRHHITSMVGDTTAELLVGNTNPVNWKFALDISNEYARQLLKTDYSKNSLDPSIAKFFGHLGTPEQVAKDIERYTRNGKLEVPVTIGGKEVRLNIAELTAKMGHQNVLTSSMFNDEVVGMYEQLVVDATASGAQRELQRSILTRLRMGIDKGMKPFGDFTAVYSNVPRAAGAVNIITSRSWKNEAEMWAAVAEHTHLYHPSIQSLAATERKYGRIAVGYYTWLRTAHSAFIDMMVNHTAGVTLVPKILSNIRQQNGIDQMAPGTPWGNATDLTVPQNMRGDIYGPLLMDNGQLIGMKTSTLPLDVMETWGFYYTPELTPEQQQSANMDVLGKFLGSNANPIVRQVAQEIFGTDFSKPGSSYADRSPSAMVDRLIQTLGPAQLAEGLGMYSPKNAAGVEKVYTPEQQAQKIRKWLLGTKEFTANDPALLNVGRKEVTARLKTIITNIDQETKK